MIKIVINKIKNLLLLLRGLFFWLFPLVLFLISTYVPKILWNPSFNDYLEFLKILVWPYTVLVILFFFKKVVTYLFFSMDEFNFFGIKGNLKNVNEVIIEEVNKRFMDKENEEKRQKDTEELNEEIKIKEIEISKAKGTAEDNLKLAKEVMKEWKKSIEKNKKTIFELDAENKRLKEIVSGLSTTISEASSVSNNDDSKTSDPILDENSINK
ncbi:MAG TPA: hypothetical protein PK367_02230 [Candidatus Paceibacterota bacterium]|nr:hypothetical protein [Candidatus Paceibacterota bacterium]